MSGWVVVDYKGDAVYQETAQRLRAECIQAFLTRHHEEYNAHSFAYWRKLGYAAKRIAVTVKTWYCNSCAVEVLADTRCKYCGKTKREKK